MLSILRRYFFRVPSGWQQPNGSMTSVLRPFAKVYGGIVTKRAHRPARYTAPCPVICIGNFTLGGSGKTPSVELVVKLLQACGKRPAILLRGYGGTAKGPLQIDITQHNAKLVGDEALLHVHVAPTWIAADRAKGAAAITASGAHDCIVMDDGAQNAALHKDLVINVVDGATGFGNGNVFPAGPLREELTPALARTDAVLLIGADMTHVVSRIGRIARTKLPVYTGHIVPAEHHSLADKPMLAFAGIGRPAKFYETLRNCGLTLAATRDFPDHHPYRGDDIKLLLQDAQRLGAQLITTPKDWVRVPAGYQHLVEFFPVRLEIDQIDDLTNLLLSLWR